MYRLRVATVTDVDFLVDVVLEATREQGRLPPDFDERTFRAAYAEWTAQQIADSGSASTTFVIEVDGRRAGRLRVVRTQAEIELAGIQLSPGRQSHGIGTRIITDLLTEAAATGRPLTLSVEKDNPRAQALYLRLGFTVTGETGKEYVMRR
jgi:ribosomal protein S18 acetylase RimI-like enzyme